MVANPLFSFIPVDDGVRVFLGNQLLGQISNESGIWVTHGLRFESRDKAAEYLAQLAAHPPVLSPDAYASSSMDAESIEGDGPEEDVDYQEAVDEAEAAASQEILLAIGEFMTPRQDPPLDLPLAYGENRIVALPRDPMSAFIYWELTAAAIGRARATLQDYRAKLCLRLFLFKDDASNTPALIKDYEIQDWIGHLDIVLDQPMARMMTAIGFKAGDAFVHIAGSQPMVLPKETAGLDPVCFRHVIEVDDAGRALRTVDPDLSKIDSEALMRCSRQGTFGASDQALRERQNAGGQNGENPSHNGPSSSSCNPYRALYLKA